MRDHAEPYDLSLDHTYAVYLGWGCSEVRPKADYCTIPSHNLA